MASPESPLTREHVIPRARGGQRNDARIIVPACGRCNRRRGCSPVVLFLLAHPRRISLFLEYLSTLPFESVRQVDLRVFAELYAAVWLLGEGYVPGRGESDDPRRLPGGRRLHRRRHAVRRVIATVEERLARTRTREAAVHGPSCLLRPDLEVLSTASAREEAAALAAGLIGVLSVVWNAPAEKVAEEVAREIARSRGKWNSAGGGTGTTGAVEITDLDRGLRGRRRRQRVDQRRGRGARVA